MLAHIRNGVEIKRYSSEKGWMTLEDGRQVSPIIEGFVDGNDKVVPVERPDVIGDPEGPDTYIESTTTVEANRVLVQRVRKTYTAQEIDDRDTNLVLSEADQVLGKLCFQLANQIRALQGNPELTKQQFINYVKGLL